MAISIPDILDVLAGHDIHPLDDDVDLPGIGEIGDNETVYATSIGEVFGGVANRPAAPTYSIGTIRVCGSGGRKSRVSSRNGTSVAPFTRKRPAIADPRRCDPADHAGGPLVGRAEHDHVARRHRGQYNVVLPQGGSPIFLPTSVDPGVEPGVRGCVAQALRLRAGSRRKGFARQAQEGWNSSSFPAIGRSFHRVW
jgi:hypothetical protein